MRRQVFVTWAVVAAASGCVTTTAHSLPIASNPLRAEAETCELRCRSLIVPASGCGAGADLQARCSPSARYVDRSSYAACLDACPGAAAVEGQSCPMSPAPGVVCAETHKANKGAFAAAALTVIGFVVLVYAAASSGAGQYGPPIPF
jgi:hypothetical protein